MKRIQRMVDNYNQQMPDIFWAEKWNQGIWEIVAPISIEYNKRKNIKKYIGINKNAGYSGNKWYE